MPRRLFPVILLLILSGCSDNQPFTSQSTAFDQPLRLEISGIPEARAQAVAEELFADLHYISDASHPWNAGSLGRTNQLLAMAAEFSANPSVLPLIAAAKRLEQQTHGYYAPALGGLQHLWGFHNELPDGPVPEKTAIAELLAAKPKMADVEVRGILIDNSNPRVRIDFGAMARGYGLDVARQRLQESGITHARLINDNTTAVLGDGWNAQLADGRTITLQNGEALVTLQRDEYAFTADGKSYHPYLDPFSGYPSTGIRSISVLHHNAADAGAFAQALLCGGKGKLAELLKVIPVDYALVVTDDGQTILSDGLKRRLDTVQ